DYAGRDQAQLRKSLMIAAFRGARITRHGSSDTLRRPLWGRPHERFLNQSDGRGMRQVVLKAGAASFQPLWRELAAGENAPLLPPRTRVCHLRMRLLPCWQD